MNARFSSVFPLNSARFSQFCALAILFAATLTFSFGGATPVFAQDDADRLDLSVLGDDAASAPTVDVATESGSANGETSDAESAENAANASETAASSGGGTTFWRLVLAGGWIGVVLLIASIFAVSLAIRLALALRRNAFLPPTLETELAERLASSDVRGALETAGDDDSFLARVAAAGLREADRGWPAVEKALEDAISEETAAFYRKTEPLATLGNVAPMLGLLGTVVGMVATFGELAASDAGGRNLANGIYFALVTTVDGLIVAIPVLVVHSLLNGRIATLAAETAAKIDRIFAPLKRLADATRQPQTQRPAPTRTQPSPSAAPKSVLAPNAVAQSVPTQPNGARRPTATPGLEEIEPPKNLARPTLSLKPKQQND